MNRILLSVLFIIVSWTGSAQKADIRIIHNKSISSSEWQVLDEKYLPAFSENEFPDVDTVIFTLESNKRYFLNIYVPEIDTGDTLILSLSINNETVMRILTSEGPGDHFFPFFTGTLPDEQSKITGGIDTEISEYPWQVYLISDNASCGGSIIDNEWIITAAHCVRDDDNITVPASEMIVVVGANNPRDPREGKEYDVSDVIVHENFNISTLNNDIALLKLKEPINYPDAEPIRLVSAKDVSEGATDPGVMTWLTGYGITSVDPKIYPTKLQVVRLPIVSNAQASVVWKSIPPSAMMAGYLDANKDACTGDSGGPLVVPVSDGKKLAGLVSWGSSQCDTYGAYTRLSLFESWITTRTGIEITFKAPVPQGDSIVCPGTATSNYEISTVKDAISYNWSLEPQNAGTVMAINENATVLWNPDYFGSAIINIQVSRIDEISETSGLNVILARQTNITGEPEDTVLCAQERAVLAVQAEGYNLDYLWYKNNNLIESATTYKVDILDALTDDSGNYYCEISGSCGSAVSRTASLTVLPVTRISGITPDTDLVFGDNLTLEVTAGGHDLSYQWYKDDNLLNAGISQSFVLQDVNAGDIGLYKTIVSGTCGTETSREIYIYVVNPDLSGDNEILVWPTLVENEFRIAPNDDQRYTVLLFNATGKLMKQIENCRYSTAVNISDLPPGIYFVQLYNNNFRKSSKLIKK